MLSYNETMLKAITKFLNNIYYAKGRKLDTAYLPMWTREIVETGATEQELNKAEVEIIRNNTPLIISEVCEVIRNNKTTIMLPPKVDCPYCEGKGYVVGILFDFKKNYTGYRSALNCVCGNAHTPNMLIMKEDITTFHKTPSNDGYYRIFPSIVEETKYLDKVEKNGWRDIK